MGNNHYLISEASRLLEVEAHVLRYWEEELGMDIPRNDMGHRFYSENHICIFRKIKDMKEKGFQLRAIKRSLEEEFPGYFQEGAKMSEETHEGRTPQEEYCAPVHVLGSQVESELQDDEEDFLTDETKEHQEERLEQFQSLMTHIVAQALVSNNEGLSRQIGSEVADQVIRELDIISRFREEREEERYRKLDESIRCCQQNYQFRREAAASRSPLSIFKGRNKKKRFRKRSI